jgi:hypothetical protein
MHPGLRGAVGVAACRRDGATLLMERSGLDSMSVTSKTLRDYQGLELRLTSERLSHILEHPEMTNMESAIEETLLKPERVVESLSDAEVHLYYRAYFRTMVGGKFLCVVVKVAEESPFVLTAYLTDRIKKGVTLWPKRNDI